MSAQLKRIETPTRISGQPQRQPLGRHLIAMGAITATQLTQALELQLRLGVPIGRILAAQGWATPDQIETALALQQGLARVDLVTTPADSALCRAFPAEFWLRHRVLAHSRQGDTVVIATPSLAQFDQIQNQLTAAFGIIRPVLTGERGLDHAIAQEFGADLARAANERVAPEYSCRNWRHGNRLVLPTMGAAVLIALFLAPVVVISALSLLAVAAVALFALLKLAGAVAHLLGGSRRAPLALPGQPDPALRLPHVSVLVPLFREREVIADLLRRLDRLTYPKALLDVVLVLEEKDDVTRATLRNHTLPPWIRVIEVPAHGPLTTKPRAMNYALDFCRGEIIGIWDAEDAPEADQIEIVAAHFATAPPEVVCLQGALDYYNPRTNWLARCFTIEYSSWFRVVLPGIARLGLVVPLGGTTLFFRRNVLEDIGGWDAHNVTEDADLGVRLCRAGYRTEMIPTTTYEEANCRPWPWVKQRSRWLKGFMVTWLVHMRNPAALLRDLGLWRFLGFQAFFIGTLGQFLLAPVLWSFWAILLGLPHPLQDILSPGAVAGVTLVFVSIELLSICIGMIAVSRPERRFLIPWVPSLIVYFPLGCLAAFKAFYELLHDPFYWDKTQHGQAKPEIPPG